MTVEAVFSIVSFLSFLHHVYVCVSQPQHQCTVLHWVRTQEGQARPNNTRVHSKNTRIPFADWVTVLQFRSFLHLGYILEGGDPPFPPTIIISDCNIMPIGDDHGGQIVVWLRGRLGQGLI